MQKLCNVDYHHYVLFTMTGMSTVHHLDLILQAKEGAGLLPGVRVVPTECLPITAMQIREFCRPH